jgi:hypothetical protein
MLLSPPELCRRPDPAHSNRSRRKDLVKSRGDQAHHFSDPANFFRNSFSTAGNMDLVLEHTTMELAT